MMKARLDDWGLFTLRRLGEGGRISSSAKATEDMADCGLGDGDSGAAEICRAGKVFSFGWAAWRAGRPSCVAGSVMRGAMPASERMNWTSVGLRKLLMGTTTAPAWRMPKRAGMNSGQFLSHIPTRSPGLTPKSRVR